MHERSLQNGVSAIPSITSSGVFEKTDSALAKIFENIFSDVNVGAVSKIKWIYSLKTSYRSGHPKWADTPRYRITATRDAYVFFRTLCSCVPYSFQAGACWTSLQPWPLIDRKTGPDSFHLPAGMAGPVDHGRHPQREPRLRW